MKYFWSIFCLCCSLSILEGQNGLLSIGGARGSALGGVGLNFTDASSGYSNPANLGNIQHVAAQIQGEQRFALSDLQTLTAAAVMPLKNSGIGVALQHFGNQNYNEQLIALSYGRRLLDNFSVGAQFLWWNVSAGEYGNKGVPTFSIGLQGQLSKQLDIGAVVFNPLRQEVVEGEPLPSLIRIGLDYHPSKKVNILVEAEKDIDYKLRTHWGVEYQALKDFYLRFGAATQPTVFSFGLGYQMKNGFLFDIYAAYHEVLGFTPGVGLGFVKF